MKKMICLLTGVLFLFTQAFSTNPITENKSLSVVAGSGLKMRTTPSLESQVIKVIPFGDTVYEVLDSTMTETISDRIEWMEGEWIRIEHMGDQGYVFNGFLTSLPIPNFEFELTMEDLDLTSPLESWINYRFDRMGEPSIYETKDEIKMVTDFEEGHRKIEYESEFKYKVVLQLEDVEVHEAYNLMKGMLLTGYEKTSFDQKSVFVENKFGEIDRIKINLEQPIEIKKLRDNRVQISIINFYDGDCKL